MNPAGEIHKEVDLKTAITIKLKIGLGKMRKRTWLIVIRFLTTSKLKSLEKYYLRLHMRT